MWSQCYELRSDQYDNMDEQRIAQLEAKVRELEMKLDRIDKQQIKIVGDFDGTNVPVTGNGIRRKIATATP
jgi:hypothetical protein